MPALLALVLFLQAPSPVPPPPGLRVDLGGEATLFVPEGYRPSEGKVNVVLHLHGASSVIEPALVEVGWKAVLVEFNRKGLSSVYTKPFSEPALLPRLLDRTVAAVKDAKLDDDPKLGWVVVSSFSAGFGGVREMLKVPTNYDRIGALVLADSLYAGYVGDPKEHRVDPANMEGFRRFTRDAGAGRKSLLVTHSALVPDGYASTAETADDLVASLSGESSPSHDAWGPKLAMTRRFDKGRALIVGFAGTTGDDHMAHLRGIARLWMALPGWPPAGP
jgi:hypothetical protein